jgi:hypothetical protein
VLPSPIPRSAVKQSADGSISSISSTPATSPADLKRLHKELLEFEHIDFISDEMRAVIEDEWPELAHKLPPKDRH